MMLWVELMEIGLIREPLGDFTIDIWPSCPQSILSPFEDIETVYDYGNIFLFDDFAL